MFLPDIHTLARLAGKGSVGLILLGIEVREAGGNAAEHRILRDLLRGKTVSHRRVVTLFAAIFEHYGATQEATLAALNGVDGSVSLDAQLASECLWAFLAKSLPDTRKHTREHLRQLIKASETLSACFTKAGAHGLAKELRQNNEAKAPEFFVPIAELLEQESPQTEAAEALLETFGVVSFAAVFSAESYELTPNKIPAILTQLFTATDGKVDPMRSFATWLQRRMEQSDTPEKMGFISKVFGNDESAVREAHRYFAATVIPPYRAVLGIVDSLDFESNSEERHQAEFGALFVLLVSKSAKLLRNYPAVSNPDMAHQYVYDSLLAQL
ncbi:hypothetical protein KO498_03255 [Lentibacter algarum]|uniref:hypothetical protein n=1 Tax=Lentibacter algarum TaxID=576131 RepID=UPI001C076D36|nr:hypothetical protein [Lentibacter algarum]MBU2980823.1 hypothetical protein [Lentibacter algarum]